MDFQDAVKAYKRANPDVKQITLRISKDYAEKLSVLARKHKIKSGVCLRLLSEWAIDQFAEQVVDEQDGYVSRSEFDQLKAEVEVLRKERGLPDQEQKG